MDSNMDKLNINNFDDYIDSYSIKLSPSKYKELNFITPQGNDLSFNQIYEINKTIDRDTILSKFIEILDDIDKAIELEAGIFEFAIVYTLTKNLSKQMVTAIYQDKLMSIVENLIDSSEIDNRTLKGQILNSNIAPQETPFLTPQEIHPERWKEQIRKKELKEYKKKNMAVTDLYKCYKCGERRCKITQMQIRSADEPMTLMITCLVCFHTFRQ